MIIAEMNLKSLRPVLFLPILMASCWLVAGQPVLLTVGQNFTGVEYGSYNTNSSALPPDTNGAVGTNHYAEFINGMFAVYAKSNGLQLELKTDVDFWAAAGVGIDSLWAISDPRLIYDPVSQRWFASQIDIDVFTQILDNMLGMNHFLLAVSATSDPTGQWHGVMFDSDPANGNFADFPTLGLDGQGVYLSGDMYDGASDPNAPVALGPTLVSFPKSDLLLPTPNFNNRTWFGIMDYAARGDVLQPAITFDGSNTGAVLAVIDIGNTSSPYSNLVSFAVQNAGGPGATLSAAAFVPIPPYMVPDNAAVGAPLFTVLQPDGTTDLQANDARLAAKVYTVGGVLYAVHNTLLNGRVAIRWYRLRASDGTLLETGTLADTNLDLFFPSIAANPQGTVVIAFNGSGLSTTVSSFAIAGLTVNGVTTFGNRVLLKSGVTSYHGDDETQAGYPTSRWGDYSATAVDPADPTRFWTIQEFPSDSGVWSTQITELRTAIPAHLDITRTGGNSITLSWSLSAAGQLQSATNLSSPIVWAAVTNSPATNGNQLVLSLPVSGSQRYFRLH